MASEKLPSYQHSQHHHAHHSDSQQQSQQPQPQQSQQQPTQSAQLSHGQLRQQPKRMSFHRGHRRAKSAGHAPSYVASTGAHFSHHQPEDPLTLASAAASQLWTLAPGPNILKSTASETTLVTPPEHAHHQPPPPYDHARPHYRGHHRHHSTPYGGAVRYTSLKNPNEPNDKSGHLHHHNHPYHHHRHPSHHSRDLNALNSAQIDDEYEEYEEPDCGVFGLSFGHFRRFAKIQIFVFFCCIMVTLQQALSSGYFNGVITTIEKRFDISSQMSGAIISTFEFGNLATIIFVSYFGTHRHIPRWIGTGIVVTAIGSLIFAVPHFMYDSNRAALNGSGSGGFDAGNTCKIPQPALSAPFLEKASQYINPSVLDDPTCVESNQPTSTPQIIVFMIAMVLIGCGGTPIFTLGTTYIDDHVPKESSGMYMSCMYAMVAFGLVCGFLLGGFFINVNENSFGTGPINPDIFPGHPKWIGAWWAGFILLGVLLLLISIPFFLFPKSLKPKRKRRPSLRSVAGAAGNVAPTNTTAGRGGQAIAWTSETSTRPGLVTAPPTQIRHRGKSISSVGTDSAIPPSSSLQAPPLTAKVSPLNSSVLSPTSQTAGEELNSHKGMILVTGQADETKIMVDPESWGGPEYGRKLTDIPACMWRLLTNPVYMVTSLGSCMELAIVSGFIIFLPKYVETQFSVGKSDANLLAGGIAIPGACLGIFLGGYLLKKLQLSPKGAIQMVLFFNILTMGLYTALYFLGCENPRMAGTTLPYDTSNPFQHESFNVNLTASCNLGCRCSQNDLEPVCDLRSKISYYSPCFAGCTLGDNSRDIHNYSNCACLQKSSPLSGSGLIDDVHLSPLVIPGPCPNLCTAIAPFMSLLFVITLVVSFTQMPVLMVTLRSVQEEERSLALGLQFVLFRLFGYIPSPMIFGKVIDSTCLIWKAHCGQPGGFCLLYNIEQFRMRYVGVCSLLKVAAGLLFFLDWLLICYQERKETRESKAKLEAFSANEVASSIISLDRLSVFGWNSDVITEAEEEMQPLGSKNGGDAPTLTPGSSGSNLGAGDSDYNSAIFDEDDEGNSTASSSVLDTQPTTSTTNATPIINGEYIGDRDGANRASQRRHSVSHIV